MGCGCSKGGRRNTNRGGTAGFGAGQPPVRNDVVVQSQQNQQVNTQSSVQPNVNQNSPGPQNSIDRRNIEKIRREAIKRALGR